MGGGGATSVEHMLFDLAECLALDLIDIPETMNRLEFWLQRSHKRFMRQNASLMKEAQQP